MSEPSDFDGEFAPDWEWARMYRDCGIQVVPAYSPNDVPPGGQWKRPLLQNWTEFQNALVPESLFLRWYDPETGEHRNRPNMGGLTGNASGSLVVVDLDVHGECDGRRWWNGVLAVEANGMEPETASQRTGGGGRQLLFRAPEGWVPPTFKAPGVGVDIRGHGGFVMLPPSLHESGQTYRWESGRAPWQTEIAEAPLWLCAAIDKLRLEYGGQPGGSRRRAESTSDKKDAFGRDIDGREEKLQRIAWAVALEFRRECPIPPTPAEIKPRLMAAFARYERTTKSRLPPRYGATNADLLEEEGRGISELRKKLAYALAQWDGKLAEEAATPNPESEDEAGNEDEVGAGLSDSVGASEFFDPWARWPTPRIPLDALPQIIRNFAEAQSASTGADVSACAMAALAACSGALSHSFKLKMKRSGVWTVGPRIWLMLVGTPSTMKTPVISAVTAPLRALNAEFGAAHKREMAKWEDAKDADPKAKKPALPLRLISDDATVEKLGDILSRSDRGILFEGHELSGWLGGMERYSGGKGSDRAFWLVAYDGGDKYIDRVGRGELYIPKCSVSIIGGIQPAKLEAMKSFTSDGLLQRFLPVMMNKAQRSAEVDDANAQQAYHDLVRYLVSMQPCQIALDDAALEVARSFQGFTFDMMQAEGLGEGIVSFLGKLNGVHGSLMLLLHILADRQNAPYTQVSRRTAEAASRILREFAIPHALALYQSTADGGDWERLRAIASYVLTSTKERFVVSDFTSGVHALRGLGVWDVGQRISPLVAGGWLVEEDARGLVKSWSVAPGLREAMADRRKAETERKAQTMRAYKAMSPGKG